MSEEKEIKTAKRNCIFGRILKFLCRERKQNSLPYPHLSLFLIRSGIPFELLPPGLIDYIWILQSLGYTVKVKELPPQIECEGIGYHLHFEGMQLKWQECLRLQVEYVERKTISSQRIDLSIQLIDDSFLRNLLNRA